MNKYSYDQSSMLAGRGEKKRGLSGKRRREKWHGMLHLNSWTPFLYMGGMCLSQKGRAIGMLAKLLGPPCCQKKKNTLKENAIQNLSGSYQMVALRLLIFSLDHRLGQQSESGGIAKALLSLYQRNTREKP